MSASDELDRARRDLENLDALYGADPKKDPADPERNFGEAYDVAWARAVRAAHAYVAEAAQQPLDRKELIKRKRARVARIFLDGMTSLLETVDVAARHNTPIAAFTDPEKLSARAAAYARGKVPDTQ